MRICESRGLRRPRLLDRTKGTGPRCVKLPNGELRIRRVDADAWLSDLMEDAS